MSGSLTAESVGRSGPSSVAVWVLEEEQADDQSHLVRWGEWCCMRVRNSVLVEEVGWHNSVNFSFNQDFWKICESTLKEVSGDM